MRTGVTTELERTIRKLVQSGAPLDTETLAGLADHVARAFHVQSDEVAILALTRDGQFLSFLVPERLQGTGQIPMTSTTALAVHTARSGRPELDNSFFKRRYARVFEAVRLGREGGGQIQKVMSAPIVADNEVIGVIHVSRKGETPIAAGPNFTARELDELAVVGTLLGPCLKLIARD